MKKTIIFLFYFLFSIIVIGQDYHPFPTSNAIWNIHIYNDHGPAAYRDSITRFGIYGDTVINEKLFNKLFFIENDSTLNLNKMTYYAAIRENNNKQIFVKLMDNEFETLIYDFGLNIGDTITSNATTGYLADYSIVILNIDSVKINDNTYRKRFHILGDEYWIEGIGSIRGLLNPIADYYWIFQWRVLYCLKHNSNAEYLWSQANVCFCQQATAIENLHIQSGEINIYPNPTSDIVFIESDLPPSNIMVSIFNTNGDLLINDIFNSFPIELNLNKLQSGIYLVQVNNGDFTYSEKIIKN